MFLIGLCALLLFSAKPSAAVEIPWVSSAEMQAKLLSATDSVPSDGIISAAIQTRLAPGWHSYWRSPGESGLPPRFTLLEGAENIESATLFFPPPKRFNELGLTTFGYDGDVSYPLDITVKDPAKPATIRARLDTMACKDICIPISLPLELKLEAGESKTSPQARLVDFARAKLPQKDHPHVKIENVVVTKDAVVISAFSKNGFDHADLFIEIGEFTLQEKPDFSNAANSANTAIVKMPIPPFLLEEFAPKDDGSLPFSGETITVTLTNGRDAVENAIVIP